jgi:bifunctional UDP-N-acetylglucosamine pyrophosphorylase/glucosamine-1-phosphate N-acetyltransferase
MAAGSKAGASVEIKNSHIGKGAKVPHLSYVGDADVGPGSNLGAGTITANYDGFSKNRTTIAEGATVGPLSTLIDCSVGAGSQILHSYLVECDVRAGCSVGPFAYLRPGAVLEDGAKAGTFVEIKNSQVGEGTKVPHLAYVGDADIGPGSNLGAGTITANYDGFRKNRTVIGRDVRIGVDTMLIAPVEVGDSAYTGAGAVIKDDVPDGALAVSENAQRNIDGYAARKAAQMREDDNA